MKTLIQLIVIASGVFSFLLATAQDQPPVNQNQMNVKARGQSSDPSSGGTAGNSGTGLFAQSQDIGKECSIYFNDWTKSIVTLKDKTVLADRLIRYNLLTQQMEFIYNNDTAALGNPEEIASIELEGHKFIYRDFLSYNVPLIGYLEVLVEGKCCLMLERSISHRYVEKEMESDLDSPIQTYFMTENYYISKNGNVPVPLPGKKKDIIGLLTEKDVKTYIKQHKLKCENEEDLKELISYYNSE